MITLRDAKMGAHASLTSHHPINLDETVAAVAVDSRTVERGDLFVAIRGERLDGHTYIPDAVAAGATAVMLAEPPPSPLPEGVVFLRVEDTVRALGELAAYHRRRMHSKVIGITGSVGKTTTKEVLANVLSSRYRTLRNQKSLNNEIGVPLTLLALRPEIEVAVVEIGGAYALGEIEHLCGIARPSVGIVTNVGSAHIGRMGSVEKIAETKSELVACLPADGVAVLNADDPYVRGMAAKARCPVRWYGLDDPAEVRADEIESSGFEGIRFRLHIAGGVYTVQTPLLGRHSVHTALAAAAAAEAVGMDPTEIVAALRGLPVGLRLIVTAGVNGSTIIDDTYNASTPSVLAALNLLAETKGRKVAVLGDMAELGDYAPQEHEKVGMCAARVCDRLYLVGPLGEHTEHGALAAGMSPACIDRFETAEEILPELRRSLAEGDVALLKGSRAMHLDALAAQIAAAEEGTS